jgi:ribonuclease BN (tRNA processing enzyme)
MREEKLRFGDFDIRSMLLNHPGMCLGYRITYNGRSICYVTDNENYPSDDALFDHEYEKRLVGFIRETDILITDCTFLDEEYAAKKGWGHSCSRETAVLAHKAGVRSLHLFHHDPGQDDAAIERKLSQVIGHLEGLKSGVKCVCPEEGSIYVLGRETI